MQVLGTIRGLLRGRNEERLVSLVLRHPLLLDAPGGLDVCDGRFDGAALEASRTAFAIIAEMAASC